VPFKGQEGAWSEESQEKYIALLDKVDKIHIVSTGSYSPQKMQIRNEWIVDNCNTLVSLWDSVPKGGTYNCIKYARKKNTHIINMYEYWNSINE
jgi:uncharacterized phage-like protein YoqJ